MSAVISATTRSPASNWIRAASVVSIARRTMGGNRARSGSKDFADSWRTKTGSIPEIPELQRKIGDRLLYQHDGSLQLVLLPTGDAYRIALNAGLHLHFAVLDEANDLLRALLLDADADRNRLLDLVPADLFDAAELERPHVNSALRELPDQHVGHLLQLEVVVRVECQQLVLVLDASVRAFEVEARGDFLVGLVEGVAQLDLIHFRDDVERGHGSARIPDFTPDPHASPCRTSCTAFPSAKRSASHSRAASTRAPRCIGCARRARSSTPTRRISGSRMSPITTTSRGGPRAMAPRRPGWSIAVRRWSPKGSRRCRRARSTSQPPASPTSTRRRSAAR